MEEGTLINGGLLRLRGNPAHWIQNNWGSRHLVRRLELNLESEPDPMLGDSISMGELTQLTHLSIYWGQFLRRLPPSLTSLPNLQHLCLYSCQFNAETNSNSNFEEDRLKITNHHLTTISHLELFSCECRTNVHISLPNLQHLDIGGCICTDDFIADFHSGSRLSLRHLCIRGCPTRISNHFFCFGNNFPKLSANLNLLANLETLCIHSSPYLRYDDLIVYDYLVVLPRLLLLDLQNTHIKILPWTVSKMPNLRLLMLPHHFRLETLPYDMNDSLVISVKDAHVRKTWDHLKLELEPSFFPDPMPMHAVPEAVQNNSPIFSRHGYLRLRGNPRTLTNSISRDSRRLVQILELESSENVNSIGDFIGELAGLTHLYTDSRECFLPLPNRLKRLRHLSTPACHHELFSHSLSKLSTLKSLELTDGTKLPENIDFPDNLSRLSLRCCFMSSLFDSVSKLSNLKTLELYRCSCLTTWPTNLNISKLKLIHCPIIGIKSLPTGLRHLEMLHFEYPYDAKAATDYSTSFQECLNQLVNLDTLHLTCYKLKKLPSIVGLCNLRVLQLKDCFSLKELPSSLGELVKLCTLNISGTRIRVLPVNITKLNKLEQLILPKLFRRESLPRYLEEVAILDDTDEAYYKCSCFETSTDSDDECNDIPEDSEQGLIAQVPKGSSCCSMKRKSIDFRIGQPSRRNVEQHSDAKRRKSIFKTLCISESPELNMANPDDEADSDNVGKCIVGDNQFALSNPVLFKCNVACNSTPETKMVGTSEDSLMGAQSHIDGQQLAMEQHSTVS